MHGTIAGVPLLALDMYELSFHMDYGAGAAKYVDAWFRNIDTEWSSAATHRRAQPHQSTLVR